jgi:hypothetical protein
MVMPLLFPEVVPVTIGATSSTFDVAACGHSTNPTALLGRVKCSGMVKAWTLHGRRQPIVDPGEAHIVLRS